MTQLLQNAVFGTALILAAALLRRALGGRLIPEARLALWAVCLVRLLAPVFPASGLSLWGLLPRMGTDALSPPAQNLDPASLPSGGVGNLPAAGSPAAGAAIPDTQPVQAAFPWGAALAAVWLGVGLALAVWYALRWNRTRRAVAQAVPLGRDDPRYVPLPKCARLREGVMDGAPLTFGAARPTVVVPPELDGGALECVLVHEAVHARRRDNLWHYGMAAALIVYWWNPAVWLMSRLLRRDIELSCDRAAVKRLGTVRRAEYAQTLVALATASDGPAFCQTFGRKAAEERIVFIMKNKKTTIFGVVLSLTLVLGATVAFASEPWAPVETNPPAVEVQGDEWYAVEERVGEDPPAVEIENPYGEGGNSDMTPFASDLILDKSLQSCETSRGSGTVSFNITKARPYFRFYILNTSSDTLHVSITYGSKDADAFENYKIAPGGNFSKVLEAYKFGNFFLNFTNNPSGVNLKGQVSVRVTSNLADFSKSYDPAEEELPPFVPEYDPQVGDSTPASPDMTANTLAVCPVEGCTIWGAHTHDGVTYRCNGGHSGGVCDGSCHNVGDDSVCPVEGCTETRYHAHNEGRTILLSEPCPVEGCTITGSHIHGDVCYSCNGAGHSGGVCDWSCYHYDYAWNEADTTPSAAPVSSGHHGNGHHSDHH